MYVGILVVLIVCAIVEEHLIDEKVKKYLFTSVFLILTFMLALRYGQGTDYEGYRQNYYGIDHHSEVGYRILAHTLRDIGIPFEIFIFIIAVFQMFCIYRAIMIHSPYKCMSLAILYPTIYLTYFYSAIRQGILIAFFLGFMVGWLQEAQYKKLFFAILVLSLFHWTALLLIPMLFIHKISHRTLYFLLGVAIVAGILLYMIPSEFFVSFGIFNLTYYTQNKAVSYLGCAERIFFFALITVLYYKLVPDKDTSDIMAWYKLYLYGFALSMAAVAWGTISSRLGAVPKSLEVLLLPYFMKECDDRKRKILKLSILFYIIIMTCKNINSYIVQGMQYYYDCNIFTYPYISVFQRDFFAIQPFEEFKNMILY